MNSSLQEVEGNKVKLSITIDESEFDRDIDRAFRKIAKEVRLPGFRAGKVPRRVLEARIGLAPAREQALNDAIPQYLAKAVREHEVDVIDTSDVEITSGREDGPVAFDATLEVRPEVSVAGYGGLRVELPAIAVSDEEVDAEMASELKRFGTLSDLDRAVLPSVTSSSSIWRQPATTNRFPVSTPTTGPTRSARVGCPTTSTNSSSERHRATSWHSRRRRRAPLNRSMSRLGYRRSRNSSLRNPPTNGSVRTSASTRPSPRGPNAIHARLADTKLNRSRSELIGRMTAELTKLTDVSRRPLSSTPTCVAG